MDKDLKSASTEDASPLTTSSESETFDTWTVITDKSKELLPEEAEEAHFAQLTPLRGEDDEEITADAVRVEVLKASEDLIESRYNDLDDLSDGISIISESESAGRVSPHPVLLKHLSDLNMRFINVTDPPMLLPTCRGTSVNYDACSERSSDDLHRVEPLLEDDRRPRRTSRQLETPLDFQPPLRCGLRCLFYVGALLAVLAFISKVKNDSWESVLGTSAGELTQKINELELKNNLMRAEIDILAKQVKHLTTLSENQKQSSSSSSSSKPKSNQRENKVKVWPGNGNIEEIEIPKGDMKKPFKCEGNNNVDIAGMCIELPKSTDSVVDTLAEKVRVVIDKNEYLSNFEEVVGNIVENPFAGQTDTETNKADRPKVPETNYEPHEHQPTKPNQYDNKKREKRDSSYKKKNGSGESKENKRPRRDSSDEDDSGERYKKSKDHKKYDKHSSMEYENAKREADGQWHEKLMQHRESSRKNSEKHRHDKNWYIERGDSREQARVTEQNYRGR